MKLVLVGLGRMGLAYAERLSSQGHDVLGYDVSAEAMSAVADAGGRPVASLLELADHAAPVFVSLPDASIVEHVVAEILNRSGHGALPGFVDLSTTGLGGAQKIARTLSDKGIREQIALDPTPFWVAGKARSSSDVQDVRHPQDGQLVGRLCTPTSSDVEDALAAASGVRVSAAQLPAHMRAPALEHIAQRLANRSDEVAHLITAESGKPLKWSTVEVNRARSVFRWAAEEARWWSGEVQRLDTDQGGEGRLALTRRFPRGALFGITPFNFPVNLVAHKLAPALPVGAPVILKPAPKTPLSSLLLGELVSETDFPAGMLSVLSVPNDRATQLVQDARLPVISFTGSRPVGWAIKASVPRKHVTLELWGNAAAVVCGDWSHPEDLEWAAQRIATLGNYQAVNPVSRSRGSSSIVRCTTRSSTGCSITSGSCGPAIPPIRALTSVRSLMRARPFEWRNGSRKRCHRAQRSELARSEGAHPFRPPSSLRCPGTRACGKRRSSMEDLTYERVLVLSGVTL